MVQHGTLSFPLRTFHDFAKAGAAGAAAAAGQDSHKPYTWSSPSRRREKAT